MKRHRHKAMPFIQLVPGTGLEPVHPHQIMDFESIASTIPPLGLVVGDAERGMQRY